MQIVIGLCDREFVLIFRFANIEYMSYIIVEYIGILLCQLLFI